MRFVVAGLACLAFAFAVVSYFEARALNATVAELREQVQSLSAEAVARHEGVSTVRTIVEQRLVPGAVAEPAAPRPPEPTVAERFEEDSSRDPQRRADLVSVMRNASLDVDAIDCNRTTCALTATVPADDMTRFIDAASEAIGPGVQVHMVYEPEIAGSQRVTIYAH